MKRITIIGTGYVGLVTGVCLAKMGNRVVCLDIDEAKIDSLQRGVIPFYEPGLEEATLEEFRAGRLRFTTSYEEALRDTEICFLALPTPSMDDGTCDMRYVLSAAENIGRLIQSYTIIVNKSTVPVGTAEKVREAIESGASAPFDVVSNPEFLKEGSALEDSLNPERILLGVGNPQSEKIMRDLYAPFADRIQTMDIASCELSKYAANAMLATRLSFMNHLSSLCEKVGADIDAIRIAIGSDKRIGPHYLSPGIGFGGSCLPKDVQALRAIFEENALSTEFLTSLLEINRAQRERFFQKVVENIGPLSGKTLAIWGLAFKPETDDLREAPSLYLIEKLLSEGCLLRLYDPVAMPKAKQLFAESSQVRYCEDPYDAATLSDAILLFTEWAEFKQVDFAKLGAIVREKNLFDGRNQFSEASLEKEGFAYFPIGKAHQKELVY